MTEPRHLIFYGVIGFWCLLIFLIVPTGPNPYESSSRWWLSYQLFGGKRGAVMLAGLLIISFVYGFAFVRNR